MNFHSTVRLKRVRITRERTYVLTVCTEIDTDHWTEPSIVTLESRVREIEIYCEWDI